MIAQSPPWAVKEMYPPYLGIYHSCHTKYFGSSCGCHNPIILRVQELKERCDFRERLFTPHNAPSPGKGNTRLDKGACSGARKVLMKFKEKNTRNPTPFFRYSQKLSWSFQQKALSFWKMASDFKWAPWTQHTGDRISWWFLHCCSYALLLQHVGRCIARYGNQASVKRASICALHQLSPSVLFYSWKFRLYNLGK